VFMQISKVTSEHQCQQALDAEAKRCASRFVHEERHVTTIQRKLQTLTDQQQAAINSKVGISHLYFSVLACIIPFADCCMIVDNALCHCALSCFLSVRFLNSLLQGSESGGDSGGTSSTTVVDLEIKMEDLRQSLRKAQVLMIVLLLAFVTLLLFDVFLCDELENKLLHFIKTLTEGSVIAQFYHICFYSPTTEFHHTSR